MSRWLPQLNRTAFLALAITIGLGLVGTELKLGQSLKLASYDTLHSLRYTVPITNALVVYLDEKSHQELHQPYDAAWDRRIHARLIERLTRAGVRAIVFDIVFLETSSTDPIRLEADRALAAAAQASGRVVVGANPRSRRGVDRGQDPEIDLPFDGLREAVQDRWGLVATAPSYDQVVRLIPQNYPPFKLSLSWQCAELMGAPVTRATNEAEQDQQARLERWLNYYGPANWLPSISYVDALESPQIPDQVFRDKLIFVGSGTLTKFSGERKDAFMSPFARWVRSEDEQFVAGVEIQATAALNLIRGDWLISASRSGERFVVLLVGAVASLGLLRLRPTWATGLALEGMGGVVAVAIYCFTWQHFWFSWLILVLQIFIAWLFSVAANSVRLFVHNRLLEQTLSLYVTPKLARKLALEGGGRLLKPGAEKQELTIFFSDIESFTTITEGLDSNELAPLINQYFETAVGKCIYPTDGTVIKYIGDAIFAVWNAPEFIDEHPRRACEAALWFRTHKAQEINGRILITRIGLHTGMANVGNFGSTTRVDYTALGENINLASRLEGLNKHLGTETVMSGDTHQRVIGQFHTRRLGRFILKGFARVIEVFELVGHASARSTFAERDQLFEGALAVFGAGRWPEAKAAFRKVLEVSPADGPSKFYLKTIVELERQPPHPNWQGEVELFEK